MATNTIGLKIELNGFNGVITNIKQLEEELKKSKEDLKELEIGSKNFKVLTSEISKAEGQLQQLNKAAKGLSIQEKFGNFAKIGSAVTSSFAGAQAAVQLFGSDTEKVSEAAAKAQNILTIALVGREIAEGVVAATAVATTTATGAEIVATNVLVASLQRLYLVVLANPFTALLAVIGAIGVAFTLFGSKTDDAKKKSKEFQQQVNKDAGKEITDTKLLINTINDTTLSINTRQKAIDDMRAKFPAYFKDLKDEDLLSGKVKIKTDELTQAIIRQSTARALQGRLEERAGTLLDIEDQLIEATKNRIVLEERLNNIQSSSSMTPGGGGGGNVISIQTRYNSVKQEENRLLSEKNKLEQLNITDIDRVNKLNQQNNNIIGTGTKELKDNTAAKNDNNESSKRQNELAALKQRLDLQNKEIEALSNYNETDATVNAEVIDRAKKLQIEVINLIKQRTEFFDGLTDDEIQLGNEIEDLLFRVIPSGNDLITIQDGFLAAFYTIQQGIKSGIIPLLDDNKKAVKFGITELQKIINDEVKRLQDSPIPLIDKKVQIQNLQQQLSSLTPEAQKALVQFYTRLSQTAEIYGKGITIADVIVGTPKDQQNAKDQLDKLVQETIKTLNDDTILPGLKNSAIKKSVETLFDFPIKSLKDFEKAGRSIEEQQVYYQEYIDGVKIAKENLIQFGITQADTQIKTDSVAKALQEETDKLLSLRKTLGGFENLNDVISLDASKDITEFRLSAQEMEVFTKSMVDKIKKQPELLEVFFKEVSQRSNEFLLKFGEEGLKTLFSNIGNAVGGIENLTQEEIDKLLLLLKNAAGTIKTEYGPALGAALDPAAVKITAAGKRIQNAITLSGITETIKKVQNDVVAFQSTLTALSQYTTDYYNAQLSALEKRNEKIQKGIIGDTKEAADIRLETEKQFQYEKERLEKAAAKRTLQITLAQAIANTAAALIKVTEQTGVFATFAAGIVAAINAKQIFLIQSQLAALDSYQHGGIVKAAGGLITGPSHEFGGVMLGGGVNAEGGESIINRQSTIQYQGLLSQINQSGGGKPLVNNFDDSRIIEALAKQKSEPIRAYVIEQDISSKQAVSRRLQELSRI